MDLLDDMVSVGDELAFQVFGDPVTVRRAGQNSEMSVVAVIEIGDLSRQQDMRAEISARPSPQRMTARMLVRAANYPDPKYRDQITQENKTVWYVSKPISSDAGVIEVALESDAMPTF